MPYYLWSLGARLDLEERRATNEYNIQHYLHEKVVLIKTYKLRESNTGVHFNRMFLIIYMLILTEVLLLTGILILTEMLMLT